MIAALKYYGLLESSGDGLRVSEDGIGAARKRYGALAKISENLTGDESDG